MAAASVCLHDEQAATVPRQTNNHFMAVLDQRATHKIVPTGFLFLAVTSTSASINWPVMKFLLSEWPPMATRGLCGTLGAILLAIIAVSLKQTLRVPRQVWGRLYV